MTTDVQSAQDLYDRLKPEAVRSARLYVMSRTPAPLQDEMATIVDSDIPPVDVPSVIDAPFVSQAGAVLSCTLGNWNGKPTARVYQWRRNGVVVGSNSATLTITSPGADVGQSYYCNMVATNAVGSSAATQSNTIVAT